MDHRHKQTIVVIGAVTGIATMVALLITLYYFLIPIPIGLNDMADRIAFTIRANVFAVLPLLIGVITVGNNRFFSDAIDPLARAESRLIEINSRYVDNTLQQTVIFLAGTLALSTFLASAEMRIIPALIFTFVLARIAFWIGYRIDPLYRAAGMAATGYMNAGILLFVVYRILF